MPGGAAFNRGHSHQGYATPEVLIAAVRTRLGIGTFTFDFAADKSNTVAPAFWTQEVDSLQQPLGRWYTRLNGGWGWLNPPFDDIAPWAAACAGVRTLGGQVAFLVPAAVGSNWWRDHVHNQALVLLVNGRIPFDPERPHWGYPKDCALCVFAPQEDPGYEVWTWLESVPADVLAAHKARCAEARAAEAARKKAEHGR